MLLSPAAFAAEKQFNIEAQPLANAIAEFSRQSGEVVTAPADLVRGKLANPVQGSMEPQAALAQLVRGAGLRTTVAPNGALIIESATASGAKTFGRATGGEVPAGNPTQAAAVTNQAASRGEGQPAGAEEIIVTANRRAQNLRDVPANVSVVTGQALEAQAATGFEDYLRQIPGVAFNKGGDQYAQISIRGISTSTLGGTTTQQPVGIYIDETPFTDVFSSVSIPDLTPFDLNRVEVLRGPQGALYGSGSMGGAIRYVTEKPKLDRFEGKVNAAISSTESGGINHLVQAMVNAPFSDTFAIRAVVSRTFNDGYIDEPYLKKRNANSSDSRSGRLLARWQPIEPLTVTASFLYQKSTQDGSASVYDASGRVLADSQTHGSSADYAYKIGNLTAEYDFGAARLMSSTSYTQKKRTVVGAGDPSATIAAFDGALSAIFGAAGYQPGALLRSGINDQIVHGNPKSDGIIQEVRLTSADTGRFNWMVGGVYTNILNSNPLQSYYPGLYAALRGVSPAAPGIFGILPNDQSLVFFQHSRAKEIALYGEARYKLTDQLEVTAGGRWFDYNVRTALGLSNVVLANITNQIHDFMPKVNIAWRATPDLLAYATVARGYRVGGVNDTIGLSVAPGQTLAQVGPPLQYTTDNLWSYEVGVKSSWLDRRLTIDLAAFYIDWKDLQLSAVFAAPSAPGGLVQANTNFGSAHSKGIEASLGFELTRALRLTSVWSWTDARLDENGPVLPDPLTGARTFAPTGTRLPGSREWQVATTLTYAVPLDSANLTFSASHQWSSPGIADLISRVKVPSNHFVDLLANANWGDGWEAGVFARNVLNAHRPLTVVPATSAGPASYFVPTPRTIGLRLAKSF